MDLTLVNLSFYRFFPIGDKSAVEALRTRIKTIAKELELRGTILIASEGVNCMVAGSQAAIDIFKTFAKQELGMEEKSFKEALVKENSFTRLLVKHKKEIISVGDPSLQPSEKTAKRVSASELKQWLSEKRPMVLLDTRNLYEVEVGHFEGAVHLNLDSSRDFADEAKKKIEEWKDSTVVSYCTGGIRCEKASALLLKMGLSDVFQLDGGILRYFEENGGAHYKGNCFVFDWRLAVDEKLAPIERASDSGQPFGRHRRRF